jgi:hypothetical protein
MTTIRNLFVICWSDLILGELECASFCGRCESPTQIFFQTGRKRMKQKERITMPRAARTLVHSLAAISLTIAVILTEQRTQANERIRTLGKDTLGISLKEFQARFPRAVCGNAACEKTKTQNLANAEATDKVYCYRDDRGSRARISPSPILNLDVRAVSAIFSEK